ncbi:MAG: hypothetical protein GWM98_13540 [Nitrospinaceae bacterium]|nr:hypothetical protein [Nitrospinaceae bacterium]NIR55307.1 hypothetical protein [Nitrospinaceae bacterium]NIS85746.1 hypothetical protein [Nitrospinaceae bacterium]NIT82596.1 hypothetical protein [Nitrospinaceae bacterium]NIU96969.1 hypothetical protein [Nitrospinaceae bacterium]
MLTACVVLQGCSMQWGAELQMSSKSQILMSEDSQVKLRSLQSRVYDTSDKQKIMKAAIATMQDMFFDIDVLDEDLGVISGRKWFNAKNAWADNPTYYLYKTDNLIIFNRTHFRTYGPFEHRTDLVRLTITVRPKEKTRSLVRASLQYDLRAVEELEIYQIFYKQLSNSLFLSAQME